ncbi:hypothetical protein [Streptomyces sp. NPDC018000]|uniref:hypothetical protein n=1 Tax=Streptomyces sp. NPDC018000 TaxID=3365028 RepID=UPI0037BCB6CB
MTRRVRITLITAGALCVATTPLVWALFGQENGEMAGVVLQVAAGVAALLLGLLKREPQSVVVEAVDTGKAVANVGSANSGVVLGGSAGTVSSARAERTGDATAEGGGNANSGVSGT